VWVKKEGHPYDYESYHESQIRLGIQPIITTNLFPKQLESLDNSEYKNQFDTSLLPSSLTSLTCFSPTNVPNHCNLHYLSVYIQSNQRMIFKSPDNKPITQNQIPQSFNPTNGQFTPEPQIPLDELYLSTSYICDKSVLVPKNNIIIKKLVCFRQDLPLPDSVEYYRAYIIPHNFPSSLKTIHITSFLGDSGIPPSVGFKRDPNWLHSLPPTVKKIVPLLDYSEAPMFPEIVDELLKDKYKLNHENNSIDSITSIVSNDNFRKVWRNEWLKNHIYSFIQPKLIQFVQNQDNNNNIVFNFTESFCSNHIKLRTRILCLPPNGVTYYSVISIQKKEDLFVQLPNSIKKLRIDYQGLSKVGIPSSLKHLILKSQDSELIHKEQIIIPSNIEILEFGNTCFGIQDLKKLITPNIKQIILSQKCLRGTSVNTEILTFLYERNLLKNHRYQIYEPNVPISSKTTVLIWRLDRAIPIGTIPFGVRRIIFGDNFNQTILENSIPTSVVEINFGTDFNQFLSNIYLPISLKYLSYYSTFIFPNPMVSNSLPPNCTHISIKWINYKCTGYSPYCKSLAQTPKFVKFINVGAYKFKQDYNNDSKKFKIQSFYSNEEICCQISKYIISESNKNIDIYHQETIEPKQLNTSIKSNHSLEIKLKMKRNIPLLPSLLDGSNVTSIKFGPNYNQAIVNGSLPITVSTITFGKYSSFSQQMLVLPPSITYLDIRHLTRFHEFIESFVFPPSLTELYLPDNFNESIPNGVLPNNLKILYFGECFSQKINIGT
ncbi:hypothetical protein CYY_010545, partial [Polysphondylium violaceum]